MRERPNIWSGPDRVNFLCVLATLLDETSLSAIPTVLSNWRSVLNHPSVGHALGVANLRGLGLDFATRQSLRHVVHEHNDYHERRDAGRLEPGEDKGVERRFKINPHPSKLNFTPQWGVVKPNDVTAAEDMLASVLADRLHRKPFADPSEAFEVSDKGNNYHASVSSTPSVPLPTGHDLTRVPRGSVRITWDDLLSEAQRLDAIDAASGGLVRGNWESRLRDGTGADKVELLTPDPKRSGLTPASVIELDGLRHLIGLPGAGKTTVLYLMASWLSHNGYRTLFLLPSIEVSANFIEKLWEYDIEASLLSGQAPTTRIRHMNRLSEGLATRAPGGYGVTRPTSRLMGSNCALASYVNSSIEFPHLTPPCASLRQVPSGQRRERVVMCPLAGVCGRNAAQRGLVESGIWVGHIMSTDARIWYPYAEAEIYYFEYIARTFDVVIVDEVDMAQAMLDQRGATILHLTGHANSFDDKLHKRILGRIAGSDNTIIRDPAVRDYANDAGTFGDFNRRLVTVIRELDRPIRESFKDQLITTNRIFSALCPIPNGASAKVTEKIMEQRWAYEAVWTENAKSALYSPIDDRITDPALEDLTFNEERVRKALEINKHDLDSASRAILSDMRNWVTASWNRDVDLVGSQIIERFANFMGIAPTGDTGQQLKVLLGATFVILQYLKMAPMMRNMISRGILDDTDVSTSPSAELSRLLPESILGRLSGVRYQYDEDAAGAPGVIGLQHVSFSSAPRMLLYRLHEMFAYEGRSGPAVLLTSATSYLEQSPGYHVPVGPDYVLRRIHSGSGWKNSQYSATPIPDPDRPGRFLRISGVPIAKRDAALCRMVDELIKNGDASPVSKAIRHNDVQDGIGRRVAFVVNSYKQVELVKNHIDRRHRGISDRVRAVVSTVPTGTTSYQYLTASQADGLSYDEDWDIAIFPMGALGRGVNIVFPDGPRKNQGMIGTIYFLIRPHPSTESLSFIQGIAGSESLAFDRAEFPAEQNLAAIDKLYMSKRGEIMEVVRRLLRHEIRMGRLGPLRTPFVADNMIQILQTIGRAMRGDRPAFVHFVDAAWAPRSALGDQDTSATSMLVAMIEILEACMTVSDPVDQAVYEELYRPFHNPMSRVSGLIT
ncbi:MAG: hypothetical protein OQK35_02840 [Alphaproteobacteria bacterium]|nr:hypothetical protein [Alphaproteobacteria bacterium]